MNSPIPRRRLLQTATALSTTGALLGVEGMVARALHAQELGRQKPDVPGGYGKLRPTPAQNTGEYVLAVPEGFSYTVFGGVGSTMTDGNKTPGSHDGMAAFPAKDGKVRLVRNHEIKGKPNEGHIGGKASYDKTAPGGTTTLLVDARTRALEDAFVSVGGTLVNCAGGATPWGTWITCEETVLGTAAGFAKNHGYCFEVPAQPGESVVEPVPLTAMGRFVHEAIAIDPRSHIVYLTEDRKTAGFYRFHPKVKDKLAEGGRLEMAVVKDAPKSDLRTGQSMGKTLHVTWVPIEDPDPKNAEADELAVYNEGVSKGGATFARLEGCWYGNGSVFLNATNGGDKQLGQVWRYEPVDADSGKLTLLFESKDKSVLHMPDNCAFRPKGGWCCARIRSGESVRARPVAEGAPVRPSRERRPRPRERRVRGRNLLTGQQDALSERSRSPA
jgi:secreted PhoX family phosphatase